MQLMEIGKIPISQASPAGEDVRYDPAFEMLASEIEKLSSPAGAGGVDWKKIVSASFDITADKAKDLLVVCYLSVGLFHTEGLTGLEKGTTVLRDLLETFWENMFPSIKKMKARRNALEWWLEKVNSDISGIHGESWTKDRRDKFLGELKAIDAFLGEKMEDAPMLASLINSLSALIISGETQIEKPQGEEPSPVGEQHPPPDKAPIRQAPPPVGEKALSEASSTEMDADRLLRRGLGTLRSAATLLARQESTDSLYYRLNRAVAWISVTILPQTAEGRTLIPPPDEQVITVLRNLYKSGSWKELLQASEARVPEFLFWIDISRFSAESLQKLGFNDIARAVAMETSLYVGRLNGIEYLSFSDGTPFADDETREWLKGLDSRTERQQSFSVGYVVDNLQETLAKETAAALELVKEDKLPEALNDFRDKMNRASSAREFFIRETEFCKFLFRTKQAAISGPYVKELIDKIDIYKLDEWDPLLAVDALVTVLSGLRSQENGKDKELETNVMDRIAILSPARAVSLL